MSKTIYLISLLSRLRAFMLFPILLLGFILIFSVLWVLDECIDFKDLKESQALKVFKGVIIGIVISVVLDVGIPNKEEMYLMALTKDYEIEDVYKMSKGEIKSSIDYVFDRLEKLKEEK